METWHQSSAELKQELSHLNQRLREIDGLAAEDIKSLQAWLEQLQHSSFGRFLLQNKKMSGAWISCYKEGKNSLLFNEISPLAAMRLRYQAVKEALEKYLFNGMAVGVFPAAYTPEWNGLKKESGAHIIGIHEAGELVLHAGDLDVLIHNGFLYGDNAGDELPYGYFYAGLKPGGLLLTSAWVGEEAPNAAEDILDDLFFKTLLGMNKACCRSVSEIKAQLRQAGFDQIQSLSHEGERLRSFSARKPDTGSSPHKYKRQVAHTPRRSSKKGVCFFHQALAF